MAEELRWKTLAGSVADGTSSASADSEFRNETNGLIHIRQLYRSLSIRAAAPAERCLIEISKKPTATVDEDVFFTWPGEVGGNPTGGTPADGEAFTNGQLLMAKGQLTLEPNESLFVNVAGTSGGGKNYNYTIGYHFD